MNSLVLSYWVLCTGGDYDADPALCLLDVPAMHIYTCMCIQSKFHASYILVFSGLLFPLSTWCVSSLSYMDCLKYAN